MCTGGLYSSGNDTPILFLKKRMHALGTSYKIQEVRFDFIPKSEVYFK